MKRFGSAAEKLEGLDTELDPEKVLSDVYESRRFGSTLEMDLLLSHTKVCSLNCVNCTLGETTVRLNQVKRDLQFFAPPILIDILSTRLRKVSQFSSLVLGGNGEPTLYPQFPEFIPLLLDTLSEKGLRAQTWLLSNGAHFDSRKIVDAANLVDNRVLKIDAGTERIYKQVTQPLARVTLNRIMATSRQLRDYWISATFFSGRITNLAPQEVDEWIEVVGIMKPKGVFIQTTKHKTPHAISNPCTQDDLYSVAAKLERKTGIKAKVID